MKRLLCVVCVTFLMPVLLTACGDDQAAVDTVGPRLQEMVSSQYAAYKAANNLPENAGVLVYLQTPKGAWTVAAGLPAGVNENYHYRVASVTKTFTASAIMLLDQQGKLNINDKITDKIPGGTVPYLPDTPSYNIPYKSHITIRQLLSHRAGVYDITNDVIPSSSNSVYAGLFYSQFILGSEPDHQFTFEELAGVVALNQPSYWAPDGGYHYSNTGYTLLASIIERVSGKSYDRFITDNFIQPLGLSQTSVPWSANDRKIPAPFLHGYSNYGSGFYETTEDNMSLNVAEGNAIGTPADMSRWMKTLLTGAGPLSKEQITRMTTIQFGNTGYALGIERYADIGLGHTGGHQGFMNIVIYNPQDDISMVVLLPFIDFNKVGTTQGQFLMDLAKQVRKTAGYTETWQ